MKFQQLLEEVKEYVLGYFKAHHDKDLIYHDLEHTKDVAAITTRLANHYQLNDEDFFALLAAAWFHDTGYFLDRANHEDKSAELADDFLKGKQVTQPIIDKIKGCILATKMPQKPEGLLQQIICDADLFHLGMADFKAKSKVLRKEFELFKHTDIDKDRWRDNNIALLSSHRYFTDYAQLMLNDQQEKNLQKLKQKQHEVKADAEPKVEPEPEKPAATVLVKDENGNSAFAGPVKEKSKKDRPEKGIETMFRITSSNNQRLSDMADSKAHILITVNSIILSAIISLVLKKLDENAFLAIPSFILLTISLLSMIFSILATRPSIPEGTFNEQDVENKSVNLLFFGNFYRMPLADYTQGMIKVMNDTDFLYGTLIKDVYSQGVVLGRKYRFLRAAYNIFMFGLVISVAAFIISSIIHSNNVAVAR